VGRILYIPLILFVLLLIAQPANAGLNNAAVYNTASKTYDVFADIMSQPVKILSDPAVPASNKVKSLLKNGWKFTPAGAVKTAAMGIIASEFGGYVWDEVEQWWYEEKSVGGGGDPIQGVWFNSQYGCQSPYYSTTAICTVEAYTAYFSWDQCTQTSITGGDTYKTIYMDCQLNNNNYPRTTTITYDPNQSVESEPINVRLPLSDQDFADAIGSASPSPVGETIINNNSDTDIENIVNNTYNTNTQNTTVTSTTTTDPNTGNTTTETQWPGFCEWASIVCDFIDWVREPLQPQQPEEMPKEEIGALQNYGSGLGTGSCPAPTPFGYNGNTFQISYDPACQAMSYFRPLGLAIASLIAGFILIGHRGTD